MVTDDKGANNEKAGNDTQSEGVGKKSQENIAGVETGRDDPVSEEKKSAAEEVPSKPARGAAESDNSRTPETAEGHQRTVDSPEESAKTAEPEQKPETAGNESIPVEDHESTGQATSEQETISEQETTPEQEATPEQETTPVEEATSASADKDQETVGEAKAVQEEPEEQHSKSEADREEGSGHDKDHGHEEDEEDEGHHLDYSNYSKKQLIQVLESLLKEDDMVQVSRILKEIKPAYDDLHESEKEEAFRKYIDQGGEKDGFEYKDDDQDLRFKEVYNTLRDRKNDHFSSLDKQRGDNLIKKQDLLERLRELVDSEETVAGINDLKKIQQEWRQIGPVVPQHMKSLWANYNALIDRYYDQRSIYFELKELDRKKNLKLKNELCVRAEKLVDAQNIKEAIKELNELHEEFKLIGPVPKEEQEPLWQRFKAASDQVYSRRKEHYDQLKEQLELNLTAKLALVEKVDAFRNFGSDRISEWNSKTREILDIQKEWESIGAMPRDRGKDVNKSFWSAFKSFFANKGSFFKHLEEQRRENLEKKEALVAKALDLKDSDDFDKTAETLKQLQRDWKDIGPVPQKHRDEIFKRFKVACDHFFQRKRANQGKVDQDYKENLVKKEALCQELEAMEKEKADADRIATIIQEYGEIGFVPKNAIKRIQRRFSDAAAAAVERTGMSEEEKHKLKFNAQFQKMNFGPGADRFLEKKENGLRRQIAKLENDISLWKNNLDFFADSKQADKVRHEFNQKIDQATQELKGLKQQLSMLTRI